MSHAQYLRIFPGYTDAQRDEVKAALIEAGLSPCEDFDLALWLVTLEELSPPPAEHNNSESEYRAIYDAIAQLDILLKPRLAMHGESEGQIEVDSLGFLYRTIRPTVLEIARQSVAEGSRHREIAGLLRASTRNAAKGYQISVGRRIAELWIVHGGDVRADKKYGRFFAAVASPVYKSDFGRSQNLCWTENTFRDHVKAWRKRKL